MINVHASCVDKAPWPQNTFVRTVPKIEYYAVVSAGMVAVKFRHKGLWEWTKQDFKPLEEATELFMIEVISESWF